MNTVEQDYRQMVTNLESNPQVIMEMLGREVSSARLLHAAMGVVTEAGEVMDQMKKHLVYGKELDTVNFQEELGDILWYVTLAALTLGTTTEQLLIQNMAKLRVRFGDKFDFAKVLDRDLAAERMALEDNAEAVVPAWDVTE